MISNLATWLRISWQRIFPPMPDFQGMLGEQCRCLVNTLEALSAYLAEGDAHLAARVRECVTRGHDQRRRDLDRLHRSFVTPIDREDIDLLMTRVGHVFDYAETAVREIELLALPADEWMREMTEQLLVGARTLSEGIDTFAKAPADAAPQAELARRAERKVEDVYRRALVEMFQGETYRALVRDPGDPGARACLDFLVAQIKRREVYRHLSNAADRLAHAGEALHDLSVKYG